MNVDTDDRLVDRMCIRQLEVLWPRLLAQGPRHAARTENYGVAVPGLVGRNERVAHLHPADPLEFERGGELLRIAVQIRPIDKKTQEPVSTRAARGITHERYAFHIVKAARNKSDEVPPCLESAGKLLKLHPANGHADLILVEVQRSNNVRWVAKGAKRLAAIDDLPRPREEKGILSEHDAALSPGGVVFPEHGGESRYGAECPHHPAFVECPVSLRAILNHRDVSFSGQIQNRIEIYRMPVRSVSTSLIWSTDVFSDPGRQSAGTGMQFSNATGIAPPASVIAETITSLPGSRSSTLNAT